MHFPGQKSFAFTVFDDTDNGTVENLRPVYDLLIKYGLRTTKSVWMYPSRGSYKGESLQDPEYRAFVLGLKDFGFEIALHNIGDGAFSRSEILNGLDAFRDVVGYYPTIHTNHGANPDLLYWGSERFVWPISTAYKLLKLFVPAQERPTSGGSAMNSPYFWGDAAKRHVKFMRNLTFNGINLQRYDPRMPYLERSKQECSNYWFSSSDAHTVEEWNQLLSTRHIDQLEQQNGLCIVYTHFGNWFVSDSGKPNSKFVESIANLSARNGWFVPVGELLDYLISVRGDPYTASYAYLLRLNILWLIDRVIKRFHFGR